MQDMSFSLLADSVWPSLHPVFALVCAHLDDETLFKASHNGNKRCASSALREMGARTVFRVMKSGHERKRQKSLAHFKELCRTGSLWAVQKCMPQPLNFLNAGFIGAIEGEHVALVKFLFTEGASRFNIPFRAACKTGNISIINFFLRIPQIMMLGLMGACEGGKAHVVRHMIQLGVNDWDAGLRGACAGGQLDMVNSMIKNGASDWNMGLMGACEGGHLNYVIMMINKGANDLHSGLCRACENGHLPVVAFLIAQQVGQSRAEIIDQGAHIACIRGQLEILRFLSEQQDLLLNPLLREACAKKYGDLVDFLIHRGATFCSAFKCPGHGFEVNQ